MLISGSRVGQRGSIGTCIHSERQSDFSPSSDRKGSLNSDRKGSHSERKKSHTPRPPVVVEDMTASRPSSTVSIQATSTEDDSQMQSANEIDEEEEVLHGYSHTPTLTLTLTLTLFGGASRL